MGYFMKVKEFKMWLEGVLAFQEDKSTWKPTAKQWKTILEKIYQLEEVEYAKPPQNNGARSGPQGGLGVPITLEEYAKNPPVNPTYTVHSPEQLEAMKRNASGVDMIDVPIANTEKYESPFA
jgi:hypothetical protein